MEWINVNHRQPENQKNVLGMVDKKHRAIVFYIKEHTEEIEPDEDFELYDEKEGVLFYKEGWYEELEQFQHQYDFVWATRNITHWQPLPEPPKDI